AALTQRNQIIQRVIARVAVEVMDLGRERDPTSSRAVAAARLASQHHRTHLPPACVVAAARGRATLRVVLPTSRSFGSACVLRTPATVRRHGRAARLAAWSRQCHHRTPIYPRGEHGGE